jgi:hypothetical protein
VVVNVCAVRQLSEPTCSVPVVIDASQTWKLAVCPEIASFAKMSRIIDPPVSGLPEYEGIKTSQLIYVVVSYANSQ